MVEKKVVRDRCYNKIVGFLESSSLRSRLCMENRLTIKYPQNWLDALQLTQKSFEEEAKMAMASKLYEMKRISSGMAAKLVGVSRSVFLLSLHRFGVSMIDLDEAELMADIENA